MNSKEEGGKTLMMHLLFLVEQKISYAPIWHESMAPSQLNDSLLFLWSTESAHVQDKLKNTQHATSCYNLLISNAFAITTFFRSTSSTSFRVFVPAAFFPAPQYDF